MEKKNYATVYLPEFFSTRQKLLIWRVTIDLRVGHSIYELTFHPRITGAVRFAVSGGDALIWRVTIELKVGHSIYELTFHSRIAGAALFAVSGGDALT
jgi:hypothetical protein